jgi:uridine phosphorylase
VASTDLFHDHGAEAGRRRAWKAAGALAVDLSAAAVLAVGRRVGVAVACALVVAQAADGHRLGEDELDAAVVALAERAAGALGAAPQPAPEPAS